MKREVDSMSRFDRLSLLQAAKSKTSIAIEPQYWRAAKIAAAEQALSLSAFLKNAILREFSNHRGVIAAFNADNQGAFKKKAPAKITDADWQDLLRFRVRDEAEKRALDELEKYEQLWQKLEEGSKTKKGGKDGR